MGPMTSNLTRCLVFSEIIEYQCIDICCPKTSSCASKPLLLRCLAVNPKVLCQVLLGFKVFQMGAHGYKHNQVSSFCSKSSEYQCFEVYCPETSSCASKPILMQCKLVKPNSIDSLYSTDSVNVYVPSKNQNFGIKLREGGKYSKFSYKNNYS